MRMQNVKWLGREVNYEGFPLLIRKPDYSDIWSKSEKLPLLLSITQELLVVKEDGLPKYEYNMSLMAFDHSLCRLFQKKDEGMIFLIETYAGKRNYYYYICQRSDYLGRIAKIKGKFPREKVSFSVKPDEGWGFLEKYPFKLY